MSDSSDIELDSDGYEIRSEDSRSSGSLRDFVSYTDDDSDPEWLPPPKNVKRVIVKPVRFADQVFQSSEEEESSEESDDYSTDDSR